MNIDIIKISKIRNLKQLKHYNINKPLNSNNDYLFHYLIFVNNLIALKLIRYPINIINNDGYNGLMLAAKENKYEILDYFIKEYPEFIYNKNNKNNNFLYLMDINNISYYKIIANNKIEWDKLFQTYSIEHISPLNKLFETGSYNIIKKIIYFLSNILFKVDYSNYISNPYTMSLLLNTKLNTEYLIKIFDLLYESDNKIFTYVDDMGYNIAYSIVLYNDIKLVHYIVKKIGNLLDQYSPISTNHIFKIAYNMGIRENNFTIARYILDNVMKHHDFTETDKYGDNIINFILNYRLNNKGDKMIEKKLLSRPINWTTANTSKITTLDLITMLDYKEYHKYVKQLDKCVNYKKIKNIKWANYIKSIKCINVRNNIKILKTPYTNSNIFQALFTDTIIYCIYIYHKYKKYKNLIYIPHSDKDDIIPLFNNNITINDNLLSYYNNFAWLIIWNNTTNYWIHPFLNKIIKNNMNKYKYAFIILSIELPQGGLHAGLIFYDFTNNIIERFDPYGNTTALDANIDIILEKELTKNLDMIYIKPSVYFPVSGFQTISDEDNIYNAKQGDIGGFCLAWCFWYIEHRLLNKKINPKILIRKTLNKLMILKVKPMEYIRNYANILGNFRLKFYKKIGMSNNICSNEYIDNNDRLIIFKKIIKQNKSII